MKKILTILILSLLTSIEVKAQCPSEDSLYYTSSKVQREYWKGFLDYLELKKVRGSKELDKNDHILSQNLFNEYNKIKGKNIDYSTFVWHVQESMRLYREKCLEEIHTGKSKVDNLKSDTDFMPHLSKRVDGWAGSLTTSWYFPSEVVLKIKVNIPNPLYSIHY